MGGRQRPGFIPFIPTTSLTERDRVRSYSPSFTDGEAELGGGGLTLNAWLKPQGQLVMRQAGTWDLGPFAAGLAPGQKRLLEQ